MALVYTSSTTAMLLAPAGSPEALDAALDAGADLVYVGLKGWSRGGARGELDAAELAGAVRRAGARGAGIQVALNTIPRPAERGALFAEVERLLGLGIRALIVNDVGILAALQRAIPGVRLTASIGCGARTAADVAFFAEVGATAVVLPATVDPEVARACVAAGGGAITVEVMVHMVEEFVLLGRCAMPSYVHLKPTALPGGPPDGLRQTGSMKRGGVGACFRICQEPWALESGDGRRAALTYPSRQLSRLADVPGYLAAGVGVLKLQGRSLPPSELGALVARYRRAIDAARSGRPAPATPAAALPPRWTVVGR